MKKGPYYTNKGYQELQINFVGIKSSCHYYNTFFQSRSTLYKYVKEGCKILKVTAYSETAILLSLQPIIKSVAKLSAPGSKLAFRGQNFATTVVMSDLTLPPIKHNSYSLVCLNTGYEVTLVNRIQLLKNALNQKINVMPVLLKVRGIGIPKNELKMFSLAILYFPSFDQLKVEIYICIRYKLPLIHRLKANMIINNDVLGIENFLINLGTSLAHICS